jgi:hypothetical protein
MTVRIRAPGHEPQGQYGRQCAGQARDDLGQGEVERAQCGAGQGAQDQAGVLGDLSLGEEPVQAARVLGPGLVDGPGLQGAGREGAAQRGEQDSGGGDVHTAAEEQGAVADRPQDEADRDRDAPAEQVGQDAGRDLGDAFDDPHRGDQGEHRARPHAQRLQQQDRRDGEEHVGEVVEPGDQQIAAADTGDVTDGRDRHD